MNWNTTCRHSLGAVGCMISCIVKNTFSRCVKLYRSQRTENSLISFVLTPMLWEDSSSGMTGLASSGAFEFKLFKLRQDSIDTPDPLGRSRFESHPEEFVDGDPLLAMKHQRLKPWGSVEQVWVSGFA